MTQKKLTALEAKIAVLETTLEPSLTLARALDLSLDDLQTIVAAGYYRQYRDRGLSQEATARRLRKSVRTIYSLAKTASSASEILGGSKRLGWQREIVRIVGTGVADEAEVLRRMRSTKKKEFDETLANLEQQGVIFREDDKLRIAPTEVSMIAEDWDSRLESLRHFLGSVSQVVYQRFFRLRPGPGFARVLSFRGTPGTLDTLSAAAYEHIKQKVIETDELAETASDAEELSMSLCFSERPNDPLWRLPQ